MLALNRAEIALIKNQEANESLRKLAIRTSLSDIPLIGNILL